MTEPEIDLENVVRAEFKKLVRTDYRGDIENVPLAALGVDSLDFFEKILYLEDEYKVNIPIKELNNDITLEELLAIVNR